MALSVALCRGQRPISCLLLLLACLVAVGMAPAASQALFACSMGANAVLFKGRSNFKRFFARSVLPEICATLRHNNQDWEVYTARTTFYNQCCVRLYSVNGVRTHRRNDQHRCVTTLIWGKCGTFCGQERCGLEHFWGYIKGSFDVRHTHKYA